MREDVEEEMKKRRCRRGDEEVGEVIGGSGRSVTGVRGS